MPILRTISLVPFEVSAATLPFLCSASVQQKNRLLVLDYTIAGPLQHLIIPAAAVSPGFTPDLWQRTCCECFQRQDSIKNYTEWNFSPCGSWWACAFNDYRAPARQQPQNFKPRQLDIQHTENLLTLTTAIDCQPAPGLRIGPALILQHADGSRSHWAMAHPGGTPDFHNAETCAYLL